MVFMHNSVNACRTNTCESFEVNSIESSWVGIMELKCLKLHNNLNTYAAAFLITASGPH